MNEMPTTIWAHDGHQWAYLKGSPDSDRVKYIRADALDAGLVQAQWQPIETVPKHKGVLLVTSCGTIVTGRVLESGFESIGTDWPIGETHKPTHWMPLPTPPEGE